MLTVDGVEVYDGSKDILNLRQEVGMVFQQFNLFPHLTVLENLTIGPMKVRKTSRAEADETARKYLDRVHIPEQADKYPRPCPAASSNAWPSRDRFAWKAGSCCLTNRPRPLIRR